MPHHDSCLALVGPSRPCDRRPRLLARNRIAAALRAWFSARDFVEVEAAILQVSPGNEAHLSAFSTTAIGPDGAEHPLYLHTSPEFACKKLLAAGEARLFSLGPVYRNRERGALHHPEFTMLEWYRAGETYDSLMRDCAAILRLAAETAGTTIFTCRGIEADPFAEPERLTVAEAFRRHAGIDLLATVAPDAGTDRPALAAALHEAGIRTAPDDTWADLFSRVMVERVEPALGRGRATILCEYPIPRRRSPGRAPPIRGWRAVRTLCVRRRARQRLRRTDRSGRAAPALRRRDGREGARLRRALPPRRGLSELLSGRCRRRAASRSASTARHAGDRRPPDRGRDLDADGRVFPVRGTTVSGAIRNAAISRRAGWCRRSACRRSNGWRRATRCRSPRRWPS